MIKNSEGYQKLKIINDWTTIIELGGEDLDFDKYYDIKLPNGRVYRGCKVYSSTNHYQGLGGMSESSTEITPFFKVDGLEAKLRSGFLMRVNEQVTIQKHTEKNRKRKKDKLQRLYEKRNKLNKEITDLKSR